MWLTFDRIEPVVKQSRKGDMYSAYEIIGTAKGFQGAEDKQWRKTVFDNTTATIIEKGIARPELSVVKFFQSAVKPGDTVVIKSRKALGRGPNAWDIESLQLQTMPDYAPLSDEEAAAILARTTPSQTYQPEPSVNSSAPPSESSTPPWVGNNYAF